MPALQGLSGLYADPQDTQDYMDEGVLEAKGFTLNPEHGEYGSQSDGYSGTVPTESPYSPMTVYDGWDSALAAEYGYREYDAPGRELDRTPQSHAAPYPRGIIMDSVDSQGNLATVADQMRELHRPDLGGQRLYLGHSPAGHEEQTHYTTNDYVAPNESYQSPGVPGQLRGSGGYAQGGYGSGHADTVQGYGVLNTLPEFNAGHSIRREQHDSAHFDYTNTHGEQNVPFYGRHPVEQMPLDGPDSPYFEAGSIDGANVVWEGRIGDPSPYEQPAETSVAAAMPSAPDTYAWT